MNWQQQREAWNTEGLCARQACKASLRGRSGLRAGKHKYSGLLYCYRCMRLINDANPEEILVSPLPR